ncbi:hypothetical protein [Prosthecomicrobium hirschii]|uniref:hypothetical protein n=1 Tax=Prosthecodimorpha hirschii TaxID=665126 RepID=UPI00221EE284|nr:hypothetical protein [Prosthecomicrobium hirschii]MCW1844199.1 hypothetical protein [Prosthecomicrobium hirschii]
MSDQTDTVILSVSLESGRFKTELRVPLFGAPADTERAMGQWVQFIQTGFAIGATSMDAVLEKEAGDA